MTHITILYTANLRGNLELLPRLQTFIRQLKAQPIDEGDDVLICAVQPVPTRTILLDLGNACAPESWHCAATGGRSVLIGLDAMGYHAANIAEALTDESRERLKANLLGLALVDADHDQLENDILLTCRGGSKTLPQSLVIVLSPAETTHLDNHILHLKNVQAGQVGSVQLQMVAGQPRLVGHGIHDIPPNTPPDATIAGAVDFILSEAHQFQKKHS
ncbi:MAG: hypothetical protein K8L97_32310 [Anaerolineae bacterium]|nr:hypothetical protein [Anaerolineae bacterium]